MYIFIIYKVRTSPAIGLLFSFAFFTKIEERIISLFLEKAKKVVTQVLRSYVGFFIRRSQLTLSAICRLICATLAGSRAIAIFALWFLSLRNLIGFSEISLELDAESPGSETFLAQLEGL